jgi:hypothetical protein
MVAAVAKVTAGLATGGAMGGALGAKAAGAVAKTDALATIASESGVKAAWDSLGTTSGNYAKLQKKHMEAGYETINSEASAIKSLSGTPDTVGLNEQRRELFDTKFKESVKTHKQSGLSSDQAVKLATVEAEEYAKEEINKQKPKKISMISDNYKKEKFKKQFDKDLKSSWTNSDISGSFRADLIGLSDSNAKDLRKAKGLSGTAMGDLSYTTEDGLKKTAFGLQSNLAGLTKKGEQLGWRNSDVSYLQNLLLEYVEGVENVTKGSKVTPFKNGKLDPASADLSNGKVQMYKYTEKAYKTIISKMEERVKNNKQASEMVHSIIGSSYKNAKGETMYGADRFSVAASKEIKGGTKAIQEAAFVGPQKPDRINHKKPGRK